VVFTLWSGVVLLLVQTAVFVLLAATARAGSVAADFGHELLLSLRFVAPAADGFHDIHRFEALALRAIFTHLFSPSGEKNSKSLRLQSHQLPIN
jgi:hypothetical protein